MTFPRPILLGVLTSLVTAGAFAQTQTPTAATSPTDVPATTQTQGQTAVTPQPAAPAAVVETQPATTVPAAPPAAEPPPPQIPASAPPDLSSPAPEPPEDPGIPVLLDGRHGSVGGYGGISVVGSNMKNRGVVYVGAEGALLIDHRFAIGLAGYGLASRILGPDDAYGHEQRLGFGYGGLLLKYSFIGRQPYHLTVGTLVGGGGAGYDHDDDDDNDAFRDHDNDYDDIDGVFVVEPSVSGHLNLTRWARIGAQVSYRFVSGLDNIVGVKDKDLAGFAFGGNIQFGSF